MSHVNMRFCSACALSVSEYIDLTLRKHGDFIQPEAVNSFLLGNVPQYLVCPAESMGKGRQDNHRAIQRFQKVFDDVAKPPYMKDTALYLDSAGFQIQNGYIAPEHLMAYASDYHQFIRDNANSLGYAFTVDLSPGTKESVFSSGKEIYELNRASLEMTAALPKIIREKMLAILQFRGPRLYAAFRRALFGDGLAASFNRFAVGGLLFRVGPQWAYRAFPTLFR